MTASPTEQPGLTDADVTRAAEVALLQRLTAAAEHLLPGRPAAVGEPAGAVIDLLTDTVRALQVEPTNERVWLLLTAVSAAYPTRDEVSRIRRRLEQLPERDAVLAVLRETLELAATVGEPTATLQVVAGSVIVDVDHSAKHDLHTGIQRVVRSLMPLWTAAHPVVPAAWTASSRSLRALAPAELARVVRWSGRPAGPPDDARWRRLPTAPQTTLLAPWRSVVVLVEVPPNEACEAIAALGDHSGSRVVAVGHDAIPIVSADMVPSEDTSRFVRYLTAIKFAARVAGVSASAAAEFAGFASALRTQGLPGPTVVQVPLGAPVPPASRPGPPAASPTAPTVLVVGSHEPRKNHLAVLHCAEVLWREGREFSLEFIGGSGWGDDFPRRVRELLAAGRPIRVRRAVTDEELDDAYGRALVTLFPSLHEGFGLPVVESLAHGTPVITSDFGSTAQSAAGGGTLVVDPRDDAQITAALRQVLTDPATVQRLRAEIASRPDRTWDDYARELWEQLVQPELDAARAVRP